MSFIKSKKRRVNNNKTSFCNDKYYKSHKKYFQKYVREKEDFKQELIKLQSGKREADCSNEVQQYFQHVLDRLKDGFDDDDEKEIFTQNVLQQTEGKEVELCLIKTSSYCIQTLLELCEQFHIIRRFMKSFLVVPYDICMNPFASHVTETLLGMSLRFLQVFQSHKSQASYQGNDFSYEENISYIISWILSFGTFCLKNLKNLLFDKYGCHVLMTVVEVLGGHEVEEKNCRSKKVRIYKRHFNAVFEGLESNVQLSYLNVPKEFLVLLKKISKRIFNSDQITDYAKDMRVSPLLQTILMVLKSQKPRLCKTLVDQLLVKFFPKESDKKKLSTILTDKNSSYVFEYLIIVAEKEQQAFIWEECIRSLLKQLINHPVAGFIIQKMFLTVAYKQQFEEMFDTMIGYFTNILQSHHYGILVAIAKGCNKLNSRQIQFTKALMEGLQCVTPETSPKFVQLALCFLPYENYHIKQQSEDKLLVINLHGSLIVQELLKFHKPIKIVSSILSLSPEELSLLACNIQGCHILITFMQSQTIGEKNKDKLICCLKTKLSNIICDSNGSKTFTRIWALGSLKQKYSLASELAHREQYLKINPWGNLILKKCAIFQFKNKQKLWEQVQSTNIKKRKVLMNIIENRHSTKKIKTAYTMTE